MVITYAATQRHISAEAARLAHAAATEPNLLPWHAALVKLQERDVEGAAEIAAKAFSNGASIQERETVINCICHIAYHGSNEGHWLETLVLLGAEAGLSACAYSAANMIQERAKSPADHSLAGRYFEQASLHSQNPSIRASSICNGCTAVRDGLITGTPDWPKAVEIYEQAADLGLAAAMFNAANVSAWLIQKGHMEYAEQAAHWLNTLIAKVDAGEDFVDMGGAAEVQHIYGMAKNSLAQLHAENLVAKVDVNLILEMADAQHNPDQAKRMRARAFEYRLQMTALESKPAAWQNWLSVLSVMGWQLAEEPIDLTTGRSRTVLGKVLKFKCEHGSPLVLAVADAVETESNGGVSRLATICQHMQKQFGGACMAVGAKALFVEAQVGDKGFNHYTVCISASEHIDLVPIWLGATTDDVVWAMANKSAGFNSFTTDNGNMIAVLVNALGTQQPVDGIHFPEAIYVNVGDMFHTPVFDYEQARALGSKATPAAIQAALDDVKEYWINRKPIGRG